MGEILTIDELATLLKMTRRQIYTMTETRTSSGAMKTNPLPVLKINGNLRFRRAAIDGWLLKLENNKAITVHQVIDSTGNGGLEMPLDKGQNAY